MLSVITRVSKARHLKRPLPPYTLNGGSWQAQGLVAFWPLGESSAAAYLDLVNRAPRRLVQNGTMALAAGPNGDGYAPSNTGSTSNWLSLPTTVGTAVPLTVACWFYPVTTTVAYNLVINGEITAGANYFSLLLNDPTQARVHAVSNGGGIDRVATSTANFAAATWSHGAAVFTSTTLRAAYWNGGSKGTETTSSTPTGITGVQIAGYRVGASTFGPLNGRLAHIGIWDRALRDDEVAALYDPQWRWDLYYPLGRRSISFGPLAAGWVPQQRAWGLTQAVHRAGHY